MRRARCCSAVSEHISTKPSQRHHSPKIVCGAWKPPLSRLRLQKPPLFEGCLKKWELTETIFKEQSRGSGQHSATLASQIHPRIRGSPIRKSSKGVSTAQNEKLQGPEGEDAHAQIRALISRIRQVKDGWGRNGDSGFQPSTEVRERSEGLLHRLVTLQQFAEQHAWPNGEVPVQVIATMRALSRELGSLENIVRIANDSGATVTRSKGSPGSLVPSSFPAKAPLPMVAVQDRRKLQAIGSQELQHETIREGQGEEEEVSSEGLKSQLGSSGSVGGNEYAVSAPEGKVRELDAFDGCQGFALTMSCLTTAREI